MLRVGGGEPLAVGMGEAALAGPDGVLAAYGIGSCVVLALWDRVRRWGALCHIVLPGLRAAGGATGGAGNGVGRGVDDAQPARYADEAVAWAVARLREGGSRPADLCAKVCGGARLFALQSSLEVGAANVAATLAALAAAGVPVAGMDVGGEQSRSVRFTPVDGVLAVHVVGAPVRRL